MCSPANDYVREFFGEKRLGTELEFLDRNDALKGIKTAYALNFKARM